MPEAQTVPQVHLGLAGELVHVFRGEVGPERRFVLVERRFTLVAERRFLLVGRPAAPVDRAPPFPGRRRGGPPGRLVLTDRGDGASPFSSPWFGSADLSRR